MNNTEELEFDISVIEGHFFKSAKLIRELLFEDRYGELNKYLKDYVDSMKHDLDLLLEKSCEIMESEDNTSRSMQLKLPL